MTELIAAFSAFFETVFDPLIQGDPKKRFIFVTLGLVGTFLFLGLFIVVVIMSMATFV